MSAPTMPRTSVDSVDPFSFANAPPTGETPEDRAQRLHQESEARRISNEIDDRIRAEAAALKKAKRVVRLLLLGQSESGKSTTLKNFQLTYAKKAWELERASWRAVVQLNLVRSVNIILNTLSEELSNKDRTQTSVLLTNTHQLLNLRLRPLRHVEEELHRRLGASSSEEGFRPSTATHFHASEPSVGLNIRKSQEFFVRDHNAWKGSRGQRSSLTPGKNGQDEVTEILCGCVDDMRALWDDEVVRNLVKNCGAELQESAEHFLDGIERIASRDYSPTDDDVIRARLRTVGVQEYKLDLDEKSSDWYIYDVGGSMTQRAAWIPFFENCNAIIFLAPISCFDETVTEKPGLNRLEDSFMLWRSICSSPLLSDVTLVCFLNKMDLLDRKLATGVKVKAYLPSFGERDNDTNTVAKYLRDQFKDVMKRNSRINRPFYGFPTSVIDTEATTHTIKSVRDGILRDALKRAELL